MYPVAVLAPLIWQSGTSTADETLTDEELSIRLTDRQTSFRKLDSAHDLPEVGFVATRRHMLSGAISLGARNLSMWHEIATV